MTTAANNQAALGDVELLQRFLDGDAEAFSALVRRYHQELYGFLARFTADKALAEDVFQETFLQVYQSAAMFDTSRRFRPWLYTIAANKARDALRSRNRHTTAPLDAMVAGENGDCTSFVDLMPSNIPSPDEISVNLETRQAVQDMVAQMPENLREVLILSYFQEMPHKDIAEVVGIPVGTVKSRLHNALKQFAEKWKAWVAKQNGRDE